MGPSEGYMRTLGGLLICVLLIVPSTHAAFGPWDLDSFDVDGATILARTVERHLATQSDRLAIYLTLPSAQLRAVTELPLVRELARSLRLTEISRLLTSSAPEARSSSAGRSCRKRNPRSET